MITELLHNISAPRHKKRSHHTGHLLWWALFVCLLLTGCATVGVNTQPLKEARSSMEERWGVKVLPIQLSAGGYMIDFRYRVLDPEKAMPLFDRKIKPYLVDEATGAMLVVPEPPKVGALRTTREPQRDRIYFILFANPGRYVQKGKRVTVVIGDFKVENLIVD